MNLREMLNMFVFRCYLQCWKVLPKSAQSGGVLHVLPVINTIIVPYYITYGNKKSFICSKHHIQLMQIQQYNISQR